MKTNAFRSFIVIIASTLLAGCASQKFNMKLSDGVLTTTAFGRKVESGYTEKSTISLDGQPGLSFKARVELLQWTRHNPLLDPWGNDGWVRTGIVREFPASELGEGFVIRGLPLVVDNQALQVSVQFYDASGNPAGSDSTTFPAPWDVYHYKWCPYPRR